MSNQDQTGEQANAPWIDLPVVRAGRRNPALTLTAVGFLVLVARVWAVARFNTTVALGLLGAAGAAQVFLAEAVVLAPLALLGACLVLWQAIWATFRPEHPPTEWLSVAVLLTAVAVLFVPPLYSLLIVLSVLVRSAQVMARGTWVRLRGRPIPTPRDAPWRVGWFWTFIGTLVLLVYGLLVLILPSPWMPSEVVELADHTSMVGYVVAQRDAWTTVLRDSDRALLVLPSSRIVSRTVCQLPASPQDTLLDLLQPSSQLPVCPAS